MLTYKQKCYNQKMEYSKGIDFIHKINWENRSTSHIDQTRRQLSTGIKEHAYASYKKSKN